LGQLARSSRIVLLKWCARTNRKTKEKFSILA
jgi:hypothetical protein